MRNYIQPGDTVTLTAPYDVTSGAGLLAGSLFGVAVADAAKDAEVEASLVGVFDLAKASGESWTVGDKLYWSDTDKNVTTTATDNTLIGAALEAAVDAATTGRVRLNGSVA